MFFVRKNLPVNLIKTNRIPIEKGLIQIIE